MKTHPERPISSVCSAMLHCIAGGDDDLLARLLDYVLDPEDVVADRWQYLRFAERDAWAAVALLLLRKTLVRRFREGELDAWVKVMLFGDDIRRGLESFFEWHRSIEFPAEPKGFGTLALQELRAARLAGELYVEPAHAGSHAQEIMEGMAARLAERFPLMAQVVRHPELDIPGLAWFFLDFRLRINWETVVTLPGKRTPPSKVGLSDLGVIFVNWPTTIEEFVSDVYADAERTRRVKLAELRKSYRDGDLKGEAEAEVAAMLGRAVPIRGRTVTEAVAEAQRIKDEKNIAVAQNSLWAWFLAKPVEDRNTLGQFENKFRLWSHLTYRHQGR